MAIKYTDEVAVFEGKCTLHEAEPLHAWLKKTPHGKIDISGCQYLHTAVLQVILVARPEMTAAPAHVWLSLNGRTTDS